MRAPKARAILGGSGGMLPRKILNLEYRKCVFLHFPGEILQKKILLLMITHSHWAVRAYTQAVRCL